MNPTLAMLLDEQRAAPLSSLTERDVHVPRLPGVATALVGMRRVVKSYLLYQEIQRLIEAGTPRSSSLTLNLFTVNKLQNDLKSQGIPAGKDTLHA